jgi:hypothetical protein
MNQIKAFSLYSMIPGGQIPSNDYLATTSYEVSESVSYALVAIRTSLATLADHLLPLARKVADPLGASYGIGFNRSQRLGPALYAIGICQGLGEDGYGVELTESEDKEALNISRWAEGMEMQVWQQGLIRDVYPWNFLNEHQLSRPIRNMTLREWIEQDFSRGRITKVNNKLFRWEVPSTHLSRIEQELQKGNLIFNWQTHIAQ